MKALQEKEAEERAKLKTELSNIEIKSGDYKCVIHIIEARELKPKDQSGQSDPVCYVEVFGQKFNTAVKKQTLSCVWDETFIIQQRNLDKEEVENAVIKINVEDADFGTRNDPIGQYFYDLSYVYQQKGHEVYRSWVALTNSKDPNDVGVTGYLKLSISVVGPGDKAVEHDIAAEMQKEQEAEDGGDLSSLVQMPPAIKRETHIFEVRLHQAECLPMLDQKLFGGLLGSIGTGGIDAFAKVLFGSGKEIRSKVKSVKSNKQTELNVAWNERIFIPVSIPTMNNKIQISVWDWDRLEPNERVANVFENFKVLQRVGGKIGPRWYNLYGAPLNYNPAAKINFNTAAKDLMNNYPENATFYRGRILLSFKIYTEEKDVGKLLHVDKKKCRKISENKLPQTAKYVLRCQIFRGSEMPRSNVLLSALASSQLQVVVSVGHHIVMSSRQDNKTGNIVWANHADERQYNLMKGVEEGDEIIFPRDVDQVPDVFVYLTKGEIKDFDTRSMEFKAMCFRRFKVKDLVEDDFKGELQWLTLLEDPVHDMLKDGAFPGSLLLRLGFGLKDTYERRIQDEVVRNAWGNANAMKETLSPYRVVVNVFQGRNLPAADSNGLLDPYLKIKFNGKMEKTETLKKTTSPVYMRSFVFDELLPSPEYMPRINVQLFDSDFGIRDENDDFCGQAFIDLNRDAELLHMSGGRLVYSEKPKKGSVFSHEAGAKWAPPHEAGGNNPKWFKLGLQTEDDGEGEILLAVQVIKKKNAEEDLPEPPALEPELRQAYVEIIALGVRNMIPYQFTPVVLPYCEFSIGLRKTGSVVQKNEIRQTNASKKPSGDNANFLQRIVIPCELPVNPIFTPPLNLRVFDTRLGGFDRPLLGSVSIEINSKCPWDPSYYIPPQSQQLEDVRDTLTVRGTEGVDDLKASLDATEGGAEKKKLPEAKDPLSGMSKTTDAGIGVFGSLLHDAEDDPFCPLDEDGMTAAEREQKLVDNDTPRWMIDRAKFKFDYETEMKTTPFETFKLMLGQKMGGFSLFGKSNNTVRCTGLFKGMIRIMEKEDDPALFDLKELLAVNDYVCRVYVLDGKGFTPMDVTMTGGQGKSDPYLKLKVGKEHIDDKADYFEDETDPAFYKCFEMPLKLPGASQLMIEAMDYDMIGSDELIGRTVIDLEDRWFDKRWQKMGEEFETTERYRPKPIETRDIFMKTCPTPQGTITMWIDILTPTQSQCYPIVDIALPPPTKWDLQVVIWKTKDVVAMDTLEGMNDLFCSVIMEGCKKQETDTHWRCKNGKGSFNWRMHFTVELGRKTHQMKFPYLKFQLWDKDILKWNDCIAETTLDVGKWLNQAYKSKGNPPPEIEVFEDKERKEKERKKREKEAQKQQAALEIRRAEIEEQGGTVEESLLAPDNETPEQEKERLLRQESILNAGKSKEDLKKEEAEEGNKLVRKAQEMTGLWNFDPEDSKWLKMDRKDFDTGKRIPMGKLCISVKLVPMVTFEQRPNGFGRQDPNEGPFLPPPTGRLKFSFNPFVLGSQLCGDKICAYCFCCCLCIAVALVLFLCQPVTSAIILILK